MDIVLANTLKANLKAAKTPDAKSDALTLAMIALVDCQQKTAARVKRLTWKVIALALGTGGGVGAAFANLKEILAYFGN